MSLVGFFLLLLQAVRPQVGPASELQVQMGFRVSPDEISDVIQSSGLVTEAAIVTEPDPQRGERIIACVVLRDGATLEELRRFCGLELPRYMQPAYFNVLATIPRNASGKHDIQALKSGPSTKQQLLT